MYRVGLEDLLGLHREGTRLRFDPCIPASWPSFKMQYRYRSTIYLIECLNPNGVQRGVATVSVDGTSAQATIDLVDDGGRHEVKIVLGARAT